MSYLFAVDSNKEEISVSESPKGSNKVNFIEHLSRNENEILYQAVVTLTAISKAPDLNTALFKAMDKVCQLAYATHKVK